MQITDADLKHFKYNIKDILATYSVAEAFEEIVKNEKQSFKDYLHFKQNDVVQAATRMMNRGVKIDLEKKELFTKQLELLAEETEKKIIYVIGEDINIRSSSQIKQLFKELLCVKPIFDRKTKSETYGSAAMFQYMEQKPEFEPLISLILEYRSINIFLRTFLRSKVEDDGYMRSSFNVAGTRSERFASRKNPFGRGCNFQNLPSEGKINLKYSLLETPEDEDGYTQENEGAEILDYFPIENEILYGFTTLPNLKTMFIPEKDETFWDIDLSAADARVVAYTSGCKFLIETFETGAEDVYSFVASEYYGKKITKKDFPKERQIFKAVCHATNYAGGANTIAVTQKLSVADVRKVQNFYFHLCPEIKYWHEEVKERIFRTRMLENIWGARGWFFNLQDQMVLNKALAWLGSSPVSILINKGLVAIDQNEPDIAIRFQVHDSAAGTYKTHDLTAPDRVIQRMRIPLPFETPVYIPVNLKTSTQSYGNCS